MLSGQLSRRDAPDERVHRQTRMWRAGCTRCQRRTASAASVGHGGGRTTISTLLIAAFTVPRGKLYAKCPDRRHDRDDQRHPRALTGLTVETLSSGAARNIQSIYGT